MRWVSLAPRSDRATTRRWHRRRPSCGPSAPGRRGGAHDRVPDGDERRVTYIPLADRGRAARRARISESLQSGTWVQPCHRSCRSRSTTLVDAPGCARRSRGASGVWFVGRPIQALLRQGAAGRRRRPVRPARRSRQRDEIGELARRDERHVRAAGRANQQLASATRGAHRARWSSCATPIGCARSASSPRASRTSWARRSTWSPAAPSMIAARQGRRATTSRRTPASSSSRPQRMTTHHPPAARLRRGGAAPQPGCPPTCARSLRARRRAAAAAWPRKRGVTLVRRVAERAAAGRGRPRPAPAGAHQPGGQRHAGDGRRAAGSSVRRRRGAMRAAGRRRAAPPARLRCASRSRTRAPASPRRPGARLRAVLHHQGRRRGHRPRPRRSPRASCGSTAAGSTCASEPGAGSRFTVFLPAGPTKPRVEACA